MVKYGYLKMNKLENFGPVYLINLKDHRHRLKNAEHQFKKYKIKDYTVIEAIDGRKNDLSDIIIGEYPNLKPSEIGCITSHIKALNHWLNTSDSEYAIIMEDDFSFDTVQYWQWDWDYVIKNIPERADIVQFVLIQNDPVKFSMHKKMPYEFQNRMSYAWSTACYLIKRQYAKKIVELHHHNGKYKLSSYGYKNQAADVILYNLGNAYSMPLFTHILDVKNSINNKHEEFHVRSKNNIDSWWKSNAHKYDKEQFFNLKSGLQVKANKVNGCFVIFHEENNDIKNKKRNLLTKNATDQLKKDFFPLDTPTIIMRNKEDVGRFYKDARIKINPLGHFGTGWKPGELGIWASNYTAWQNFLKSDYEYLILMEDDIVLNSNFNEKLKQYMSELPHNWDLFTVYIPETGNIRYEKRRHEFLIDQENICKVYQSWSCLCYIVSKRGAQKLLKEVQRGVKSPLDHYLFYSHKISAYAIKPERGNICSLYETKSTVQEADRYDMTGYV